MGNEDKDIYLLGPSCTIFRRRSWRNSYLCAQRGTFKKDKCQHVRSAKELKPSQCSFIGRLIKLIIGHPYNGII